MPFRDRQKCSCKKKKKMKWPKESVEAETGIGTQVPGDDSTGFYLWASMDGWGCEGRVYESFPVPTDLGWAQHMVLFASVGMRGAKAPKEWARALLPWCRQNPMDFSIDVIKTTTKKQPGEKRLCSAYLSFLTYKSQSISEGNQGRNFEAWTQGPRRNIAYWFVPPGFLSLHPKIDCT